MNPETWRKKAKKTLREAAALLGCSSHVTVERYETGKREAPNSIVIAYEKQSAGKVTAADLNRVRKKYLASIGEPKPVKAA